MESADFALDCSGARADDLLMEVRSNWFRKGLILFSAVIVLRAVADRRPEKLEMLAVLAAIFAAVFLIGWAFARKREP